ncbi:MAG: hypothetical protein AAGA18_10960 [Verrucomicrobiota bacterium]
MRKYFVLLWLGLMSCGWAQESRELPKVLEEWKDWALWESDHLNCPSPYYNKEKYMCLWPSELKLDVEQSQGNFSFDVKVYDQTWVALPGDNKMWPKAVRANGKSLPVVLHSGKPSIELKTGSYKVAGAFQWEEMPQRILIPKEVGILALSLHGKKVDIPNWDNSGYVWLKRNRSEAKDRDFLALKIYRLLQDGIPMWLDTEIELSVAGKSREEELGWFLPRGWKLSSIDAPIPVAIDDDGKMKAQVRAGKWFIRCRAFRTDDLKGDEFAFDEQVKPMAKDELVAFAAKPSFRMIEILGVDSIDVSQTTFPEKWASYPVYFWDTKKPFKIDERMRGMGNRIPEGLKVSRNLWLADNGQGFVYQDQINGKMQEIWRLDVQDGVKLGSVKVDGKGQLITRNPKTNKEGVELRKRDLNVSAVGEIGGRNELSAVGWLTDVEKLDVTMHLPPGWRLVALFGAEKVEGDWLTAWSLLDVFLLLIFSFVVFKMYGVLPGIIAFAAMGVSWHEVNFPNMSWLVLLMPLALLRVIKKGKLLLVVKVWKYGALALLAVLLIPFVYKQVQSAIYPQLEEKGVNNQIFNTVARSLSAVPSSEALQSEFMLEEAVDRSDREGYGMNLLNKSQPLKKGTWKGKQKVNLQYDAQARIQTGPAVPQWTWRTVTCRWNGPVSAEETIRPILLSLEGQRALTLARLVLIGWLLLLLLQIRQLGKVPILGVRKSGLRTWVAIGAFFLSGLHDLKSEIPDEQTLEKLRTRLTEKSDAFPNAADIAKVDLQLVGVELLMKMEVHVAAESAFPLPGRLPIWSPVEITVNNAGAPALRREDQYLWIVLDKGVHQIEVRGLLPNVSEWEWTFRLKPRFVTVEASGWTVTGIKDNGVPEQQVFFVRQQLDSSGSQDASYDKKDFNPLVALNRSFELGLVWQVQNQITKLSSIDKAISIKIPLLPGEKVMTSGVEVKEGMVEVLMRANQKTFTWKSELERMSKINLAAEETDLWVEKWTLVTSPVWNVTLSGIKPVFQKNQKDLLPVWSPWPGEEVEFQISRPEAVSGETTTVSSVNHEIRLGSRHKRSILSMSLQCSLGSDFVMQLPEQAEITSLKHKGVEIPVRTEGKNLIIPVHPGEQMLNIEWKEAEDIGIVSAAEEVKLPVPCANIHTSIKLPLDRWVLWAKGPLQGPAIRFWAVLIGALFIAWLLMRFKALPIKSWEWVPLLFGLTQVHVISSVVLIGWLFAFEWRGREGYQKLKGGSFNVVQVLLGLSTVMVVGILLAVVYNGLLGNPEMYISGNGSSKSWMKWYQAQSDALLPTPSVVSVSIWWYRFLMLAWALWVASLTGKWMKWAWTQFNDGQIWCKKDKKKPGPPPLDQIASSSK